MYGVDSAGNTFQIEFHLKHDSADIDGAFVQFTNSIVNNNLPLAIKINVGPSNCGCHGARKYVAKKMANEPQYACNFGKEMGGDIRADQKIKIFLRPGAARVFAEPDAVAQVFALFYDWDKIDHREMLVTDPRTWGMHASSSSSSSAAAAVAVEVVSIPAVVASQIDEHMASRGAAAAAPVATAGTKRSAAETNDRVTKK